jgi:hypothetical protein
VYTNNLIAVGEGLVNWQNSVTTLMVTHVTTSSDATVRFAELSIFASVATLTRMIGSEVLMAVILKISVFWDLMPCSSDIARRFGQSYGLRLQQLQLAACFCWFHLSLFRSSVERG